MLFFRSQELFAELVEVLNRPELKRRIDVQRKLVFFRQLRYDATWTSGAVEAGGMLADPTDDFLMAAALEAKAEFIVTWDSKLIVQRSCQGVQIVSPEQFISLIIRVRP